MSQYTQTIIELKENDNLVKNNEPGDFEVTLAKPILITEGTEISLKGAFIDAESQNNGRIFIISDQSEEGRPPTEGELQNPRRSFSINFVPYVKMHGNTFGKEFITDDPNLDYFDGREYFLCDTLLAGHDTDLDIVETIFLEQDITISKIYYPRDDGNGEPHQFLFAFDYKDISGGAQTKSFVLDRPTMARAGWEWYQKGGGGGPAFPVTLTPELLSPFTDLFPLACQRGTFVGSLKRQINPELPTNGRNYNRLNGAQIINSFGLSLNLAKTRVPAANGQSTFQPREYQLQFSIEANKSYSPQDLAEEMTRNINQATIGNIVQAQHEQLCDNPMLQSSLSIYVQGLRKNPIEQIAPGPVPNTRPFFMDNQGERVFRYNPDYKTGGTGTIPDPFTYLPEDQAPRFYIGTPQFAILFDEGSGAEGSFRIDKMHGSIIQANAQGSNQEVVKEVTTSVVKGTELTVKPHFFANRNSGIVLTHLEPREIWYDKMGFNEGTILTQFPLKKNITSIVAFPNSFGFTCQLQDGLNITGDQKGLDVVVSETGLNFDILKAPVADTVHKAFVGGEGAQNAFANLDYLQREIVVAQRTPIVAIQNFVGNQGTSPEGYYLIEISGTAIHTSKVGCSAYMNNIIGIVSRYYNLNSFTSSLDGEGGLSYVHKGQSELLSRLRIRILDPNGNLADGLDVTKNAQNENVGKSTVFLEVNVPVTDFDNVN